MRKNVWRIDASGANADIGKVVWAPFKSLWNTAMYLIALFIAPLYFTWSAFALFLLLSYVTLLFGHSLGMHRRLIHKSFECSKPFERFLVWLGVLVGMAGPFGILRIHDIRECWQNNHHAFPESAKMGLEPHQLDPGWQVLRLLEKCHAVKKLGVPRESNRCEDLEATAQNNWIAG